MRDVFENLGAGDITVHVLLNLQESYPDLNDDELSSYVGRLDLRLSLLRQFAEKNYLPFGINYILTAIPDVDRDLLEERCLRMDIPEEVWGVANSEQNRVVMLNGGPGTGKSSCIGNLDLPEDNILLDRDGLFEFLPPYSRLKLDYPDHATHAVVCEAILYNEGDAFRYAILAGAPHLLVDGTMSYLDLGLEMIRFAQENGYHVKVINIDCPIEDGEKRAEARAAETGKTINSKLLYESHVRCAKHFFEYRHVADETECWHNDTETESYLVARSSKKQDGTMNEDVKDLISFEEFKMKGRLPLDNPSWPPYFKEFLDQRKL